MTFNFAAFRSALVAFLVLTAALPLTAGRAHAADTVWVDDALPAGAVVGGNEPWTWITTGPAPSSGARAHRSALASGAHQHYFYNASSRLPVAAGDKMFAYIYLDPANPPREVMLQWNNGNWEHRAYWGENLHGLGVNGTASRRYVGALPPAGQWVHLEVPASLVGLEGTTVNGMAFLVVHGRATWDHAGKSSGAGGDTTAPTVSITAPAGGAAVSGTLTVTANAADNVGVAGVQFRIDGANFGAEDTAAPFSVAASTAALANGSHTVTAVARDAAGNTTTSAPVTITVNNAPAADTTSPTVSLTAPGSGAAVSGTVTVTANASDNVGVAGVQFKLNGANLGAEDTTAPYSVAWNTAALGAGSHTLTAVARDAAGNVTTSAGVTVTKGSASTPYTGTAVSIPGTFEAENFDNGGAGVAYFDKVTGNAGGAYRTTEHVDIIASADSLGGGYVVNNFETGEWLAYTINVASAGLYDIDLRVASAFTNSAFHAEIGGVNVTGSVAVPNTGGWSTFQWVGKKAVPLTAGTHVLKIVSDQQYFNLNSVRLIATVDATPPTVSVTSPASGSAVNGTTTPVTASAADNVGVAGVQFKYNGVNIGAEVIAAPYSVNWNTATLPGGTHTVTAVARDTSGNLTTSAPITVTKAGAADTTPPTVPGGLTASAVSSTQVNLAWNAATDNVGVTGYTVYLNDVALGTTTARTYSHTGLAAGTTYNYRVSAFDAVPNHSGWTATPVSATTPGGVPPPVPGTVQWSCDFPTSATNCGFFEQAKVAGRATVVSGGRTGGTAVRLHTEPGDNNVAGSGDHERNDLTLNQSSTDCYEGREQWWGHSIKFPDDYVQPPMSTASSWNFGIVFDFHNSNPGGGQANFQLNAMPATAISPDRPTGLSFQVAYGNQSSPTTETTAIGPITKNVWYDFVYHIKWSSGTDGYVDAWVNGTRHLTYRGPTLYAGQGCYLKLANYHTAFGQPSSVIHSRIVRGTTQNAVSLTPLQP